MCATSLVGSTHSILIANSIGTSIAQWADNKARELLYDVGDLANIDAGAA